MVKKTTREIIYFILVFLLFFLLSKVSEFWINKTQLKSDIVFLIVGAVYTLIIVAIFFLAKLQSTEGYYPIGSACNAKNAFWDVSDAAKCKGGPFFWQGDSETAKMCRAMAQTPEGMVALSGYNCPTGYVGQPGLPFFYSPLSDDNWQNERCENLPNCPLVNTGLRSLEKQIP